MTTPQTGEARRLAALHEYLILDTPADQAFDDIVQIASQICATPVAMIGFIDQSRQWFKAKMGWDISSLPRAVSLCGQTIQGNDSLVIPDTAADPRFASSSLVNAPPFLRFYAGVPLVTSDGQPIGTLAVMDRVPHQITPQQLTALEALSGQVMNLLDARRALATVERNLTEIRSLKDSLEESDQRFRELFDTAHDLILTIRPDGRFMHANRGWRQTLDYFDEDISSLYVTDTLHKDSRDGFREVFARVVESGEPESIETVFLSMNGRRVTVEGTLSPKMMNGKAVLVRVIFSDISDRKQMEVELGKARDGALESARLKTQFLTNMTHEVRTPMHGIVGMLGLLLDSPLNEQQREFAQAASASADSLLGIINNILHISKLEAGTLTVTTSDFDLTRTLQRVLEVMKIMAVEKSLVIEEEIDRELPMVLRGDAARLRQVLTNLVSNAIKFTDKGKITVRVARDSETVTHLLVKMSVTDTGIGIAKADQTRVFESFSQADASTTRKHGGMGVGLSTAKQLVELMGGMIGVDSTPGKGSTFWFTLPFEKRTSDKLPVAASKLSFPGSRALIVDESETSRKIIEHNLSSWGLRSRSAAGNDQAIERLKAEVLLGDPYKAVIFDLRSRSIDGLELARRIKADPKIADTALIMMIPLGEQIDDEAIRDRGVSSYLTKPVEPSELFDCLTLALARDFRRANEATVTPSAPLEPLRTVPAGEVKILIAEDKPLNRKLTMSQLQSLGYSADAVSNGQEALDAIKRKPYDVILMDCQMPVMDGYQATMEIRKHEGPKRRTCIIAMTAHAMEGDREKCLAAGMDDYLSKPTRQQDLAAALAKWAGVVR